MNLRDWRLRLRTLFGPARAERDLHDELAFHVARETQKFVDEGMSPVEARARAQARFGSSSIAADACRDERGTGFLDNTIRDIQYALRMFGRAPLSALTIVVTVAIGLGVVAVLFSGLNVLLFRVDAVPDIDEMFVVRRPPLADGERPSFTRPQFEALRAETAVFTDAYAVVGDLDLRIDGQMMAVTLVSGSFFQVLRVAPAMGRVFGPADDSRTGGHPVIVLSDKGWNRRFDRDPGVIGRTVMVNGSPFEVVGVMPKGFRGLEVGGPDVWAPLSQLGAFRLNERGREDSVGVEIIGRLKPGLSKESARAQLTAWDSNQAVGDAVRQPMPLELEPRRGTLPQPMEAIAVFAPLFFAFGLILLIGCANVANLLLARGVARQREIGIRLSVGASRRRIVRQLLTESVLLALAAAALGYVISRIALAQAVYWALRSLPADLGDINLNVPAADWRVALFLVVGALAATAFFALLPALRATRIDPVRTLRGELLSDARPGRARSILIGIQVFASALLLICAAVFLRSAIASARFDPGLRTADSIFIDAISESKRGGVLQALAADSTIAAHAAMRPGVLGGGRPAFVDPGTGRTPVSYKFASSEYFDVLGIPIVRGRRFTATERDGYPVAIVSESVARALWPAGTGLGETLRLEPDMQSPSWPKDEAVPPQLVTVVGISRDVAGFRFSDNKPAGMFLPTTSDIHGNSIVARVNGDPDVARTAVLDRLTRVDPDMGQIVTMRSVARLETIFLRMAFVVALVLGGLALVLTISGLFSVLSYLVEQRTREIGVRMALGASSRGVTTLMLRQTARPVVFGLVAGAGLAATLATVLLSTPFGAYITEIVHVADPVAYLASLIVIVTASLMAAWIPAARAARIDPSQTLRRE